MKTACSFLFVFFALTFVIATPLHAGDNEAEATKIENKLETTTIDVLTFEDTPIKDAIAKIAEEAGISIVIDHKHVDEDTTITMTLANISAVNALSLTLKQTGLVREFTDGVVWVTTKDAADKNPVLITMTYDIRDITMVIRDFKAPKVKLEGQEERTRFPDDDKDANEKEEPVTAESVIEMIEETVDPDVWDSKDHAIATFKGNLVVTTTRANHKKIASLLAKLR